MQRRYVSDYRGNPAQLLRDLAELTQSERLRSVWMRMMCRKEGTPIDGD